MLSTKVSKDILLNIHKWNFKFGWNWNFHGSNRPWLNKLFSQAGSSWWMWRRLSLWFSYIWQKDVLQRSTCRSCLVWRRFSSNLQSWGKIPWLESSIENWNNISVQISFQNLDKKMNLSFKSKVQCIKLRSRIR